MYIKREGGGVNLLSVGGFNSAIKKGVFWGALFAAKLVGFLTKGGNSRICFYI